MNRQFSFRCRPHEQATALAFFMLASQSHNMRSTGHHTPDNHAPASSMGTTSPTTGTTSPPKASVRAHAATSSSSRWESP
jgi:hypothetical protein